MTRTLHCINANISLHQDAHANSAHTVHARCLKTSMVTFFTHERRLSQFFRSGTRLQHTCCLAYVRTPNHLALPIIVFWGRASEPNLRILCTLRRMLAHSHRVQVQITARLVRLVIIADEVRLTRMSRCFQCRVPKPSQASFISCMDNAAKECCNI